MLLSFCKLRENLEIESLSESIINNMMSSIFFLTVYDARLRRKFFSKFSKMNNNREMRFTVYCETKGVVPDANHSLFLGRFKSKGDALELASNVRMAMKPYQQITIKQELVDLNDPNFALDAIAPRVHRANANAKALKFNNITTKITRNSKKSQ